MQGDRVYLVQDTGQTVLEARGSKPNSELIFIELGHYLSGRPLSDRQREALDAFDRAVNDPANATGAVSSTRLRWRTGAAWCACGSQAGHRAWRSRPRAGAARTVAASRRRC
jgi:hypothetical protein